MSEPAPRAFAPQDLTRIRFVSDPHISPDGRRVAFVVTTLSEEKDEYLSNIWLVDVDGGEPRRFTSGPLRDTAPRWSPDGTRLAFVSQRDLKKRPQLYVMPADGGEPVCLTDIKKGVADPIWSPDGTRLAFVSHVGGWEEPESEEEKRKSKPARVISTMKYKYNGEGFTYDRHPHIFTVAAVLGDDGTLPEITQLTDGAYNDESPAWSPDGTLIAFVSARHDERDEDNRADVFVVPASGGEPRRVTDTAGPVAMPAWSPDGAQIAFLGHRYPGEAGRNTRLWTVPVTGGTPRCLTERLDRPCAPFFGGGTPQWTRDGWILFLVESEGDVAVYRVRADGSSDPERIVGGERQVTGLTLAQDGTRAALTLMDPVTPAEVFVVGTDGTGERQLTDCNRAWKAEVARARPERFRYERDGFTLDCWVMRPYGAEPGKRYPALVNIHGGPATQYGHNFFDEFQVYAGAGYAVIYTNPRGSQGYGESFTRAVIGEWGHGPMADVMLGVDEALRRYDFIDPERLGVLGGSYGGYLTSWIVGHTDRFKAACSERAVNSMVTLFGASDIGSFFPEQYSGGRLPWEDIDWYLEQSPLTYAKNITTPLLIMHSEQDLRCPIDQAEQLYIALKKLRREVLFVRFPDENHELSRSGRPRHRLERFKHLLDWFGSHLQGETAPAREAPVGAPAGDS